MGTKPIQTEAAGNGVASARERNGKRGVLEKIRDNRDHAEWLGRLITEMLGIDEVNRGIVSQAIFEQVSLVAEDRDAKVLAAYIRYAMQASGVELRRTGTIAEKKGHALRQIEKDGGELEKMKRASLLMFGEPIDIVHEAAAKAEACI